MEKTKLLSLLVIVLILINLGTLAYLFFQQGGMTHRGFGPVHGGKPDQIIIERLNFDAQQISDYRQLIEEHRSTIQEIEQSGLILRERLFTSLTDTKVNKDSIIQALSELHIDIIREHINHFESLRGICHEDQKQAFEELSHDLGRLFRPGPPRRP